MRLPFRITLFATLSIGFALACANSTRPSDEGGPKRDAGAVEDGGTVEDAGSDGGTANEPDGGPDAGEQDAGHEEPDAGSDAGSPPADAGNEPAACPAGATFCETFENGRNGWEAPASPQHATIAIDETRAHTGGAALHVITEDGINENDPGHPEAIAHYNRTMPDFTLSRYVRGYYYLKSLPPQFGVMGTLAFHFSDDNEAFGGIELQAMQNGGFAHDDWSGIPGTGWNYQDPVDVGIESGRWVCLEWGVSRSSSGSSTGHAEVWVDGELAFDFPNVGIRPFNRLFVGYGFVHPQGQSASETWIDDVVVSEQRIGCIE